jgi:hypothetical protein
VENEYSTATLETRPKKNMWVERHHVIRLNLHKTKYTEALTLRPQRQPAFSSSNSSQKQEQQKKKSPKLKQNMVNIISYGM